jgi:hypothetical protein
MGISEILTFQNYFYGNFDRAKVDFEYKEDNGIRPP